MQISKIQQPPIFDQKLQISIKSFFPNRIFYFLLLCIQEVVYYATIPVPDHGHFFIVMSGSSGASGVVKTILDHSAVEESRRRKRKLM